jgi:Zn-dependent protease with chaperone function
VQFENPQIPDGINVSEKHPLRDFLSLSAAIVALTVILAAAVGFGAGYLARHLPFSTELKLAEGFAASAPKDSPQRQELQALADRLAAASDLPAGMAVKVHYSDDDTINAFATLGGNVVVFRGLIGKLDSENALAMVLAHEIAHVKHRHPIASIGRGVAIGAILSLVSASAGQSMAGSVLGQAGLLTQLTFSRAQEEQADATALEALARTYGHVAGATELFERLRTGEGRIGETLPQFMLTHPHLRERVERIQALGRQRGWALDGGTTPMREGLRVGPQAAAP